MTTFIRSSIQTARLHGFQGIDLLPNGTDVGKIENLIEEFRSAIDSEAEKSNTSKLLLTMAVPRSPNLNSAVRSMARNLDWANLVAYDYHLPTKENFTANHAALFADADGGSTDSGVKEWIRVGFPAKKMVLGLPYHGYAWKLADPRNNSLGAPANGPEMTIAGDIGYKLVKSTVEGYGYGAGVVYDSRYVVNYFVVGKTWINFDGVEAVTAKVSYAVKTGLLGFVAFHLGNDDNWELSRAAQLMDMEESESNKWKLLVLETSIPISAIILLSTVGLCCIRRRRALKNQKEKLTRSQFGSSGRPNLRAFSFSDIKSATNNFSNENLLGSGGYGPVYKGILAGGEVIAVKRLSESSNQGVVEFRNEVSLTARLQHVNLVMVLGYCTENEEKMLVYEFMPNGSLHLYLFDPVRRLRLDWNKRVRIIEGVTQGLLYLQEYSNFTIIHRDLKAGNVLLDGDMNAKISDFGMARLFGKDVDEANTRNIVGTYGYIPPEYARKGIYSMKYDVYSFGVLLLQVISGKRNQVRYGPNEDLHLLEYAYECWRNGKGNEFFDASLEESSSQCKLITCLQVALLCVQEKPDDRPTMLQVLNMLRGGLGMAKPKRPAFSVREETNCTSQQQQEQVWSFNVDDLSQVESRT
ncbi:Cysteine-rich receptor-like protein kinase 19 [Linum grandiflorum]